MNHKIKIILRESAIIGLSLLVIFTLVEAGTLTPSASPAATSYTLSDIYARLITNAPATAGNHDLNATTSPSATFASLTNIYNAIPTIYASDLLASSTYLGVTGTVAVKTGTATASSTATSTNQIILTPAPGFYDGTNASVSTTTVDYDSAYILSGRYIFGLAGSIPVKTSDNVATTTATTTNAILLTAPPGYYGSGATVSTTSTNFAQSNIKLGTYLFGLVGTLYGDTDASKVLTTASAAGTYDASSLTTATVKIGTAFGVSQTGAYSGYPGSGWTANGSGSGSTALNSTNCANASGWYWFEDGNGDGDTSDPEDGICVLDTETTSSSWNGSEQVGPTAITAQAATGGSATTIVKASAGWTVNAYANAVVDITSGTASGCWGVAKSNTSDTITVYGSWLSSAYASNCGTPDATSVFSVEDDGFALYDNSWLGDYSCTGNFPSGTVVLGSYPTSGTIALATTDCYDGKRDLLPNETDRAVKTGTATAADVTTITDSSLSLNTNAWVGQKALITGGTGSGGYGRIESNTGTVITVDSWTGGTPGVGSTFSIIYLIPHASYNPTTDIDGNDDDELNGNNGPLTPTVLAEWKGTRLPSFSDFFGYCGYKDGGSNYESTTGTYTADKTYGNYGGQAGRTSEFLDLANSGSYEWLSEQHARYNARIAGSGACSDFSNNSVNGGYRFRAVFRP